MIEGPILLHKDNHMLDILDGARGMVRGDGEGTTDAHGHHGGAGGGCGHAKKISTGVFQRGDDSTRIGVSLSSGYIDRVKRQ
jgi:hypothetical protein